MSVSFVLVPSYRVLLVLRYYFHALTKSRKISAVRRMNQRPIFGLSFNNNCCTNKYCIVVHNIIVVRLLFILDDRFRFFLCLSLESTVEYSKEIIAGMLMNNIECTGQFFSVTRFFLSAKSRHRVRSNVVAY